MISGQKFLIDKSLQEEFRKKPLKCEIKHFACEVRILHILIVSIYLAEKCSAKLTKPWICPINSVLPHSALIMIIVQICISIPSWD